MTKNRIILALFSLGLVSAVAFSEESVKEKVESTANNAKRAVKKGAHRTQEAFCAEGDAKCLAKKAKHRVEEGTDYVKDKAAEAKGKAN